MLFEVLLPSGRGVRYRELSPSEYESMMDNAGKIVGPDGSMMALYTKSQLLGVKKMLAAVTTADGLTEDDLRAGKSKWKKVDGADLDENYDKYFKAKDHLVLTAIYRETNELSKSDVDTIVKKALPVSED